MKKALYTIGSTIVVFFLVVFITIAMLIRNLFTKKSKSKTDD